MSATEFCTFRLDGSTFGIEVQRVQEVIRPQALTVVPRANPIVEGLINLRGQIVTAIDLRRRLEMPPRQDADPAAMSVVVRTADGALSLLVDEIGDVVQVDDAAFEAPPETVAGVARELLVGAYKLEDRLLLILDVDRAIDLPQASHSRTSSQEHT